MNSVERDLKDAKYQVQLILFMMETDVYSTKAIREAATDALTKISHAQSSSYDNERRLQAFESADGMERRAQDCIERIIDVLDKY